jgi:TP901 family phage tail tape measure protein
LKGKLSGINAVLAESESGIKNFGADTKSIFDSFGGSFKRFAQYFGMSRVIMASIQKIKEMARASIEVESAMNRIQIVTGASDSQMTSFFQSATAQAKELGQSITDVAASLESFSRLGFSLSEATELSKYANIMANVADTDVATATTGITSIMKGYGLDVSETEHVADVLIKVGQEYAISAEELMEAFQRGGSAMAASNTSFEKTASLFAATNASLECWRVA